MSHEESPVNDMVPVNCFACGRTLTDATSKEKGIGPVCRDKYNYEDAPEVTSSIMMEVLNNLLPKLDHHKASLAVKEAVRKQDSRRAANVLVHHVAVWQDESGREEDVFTSINILRELGYKKLADRIGKRLSDVFIKIEDNRVKFDTPYSGTFIKEIKKVEGSRWDGDNKVWTVPNEMPQKMKAHEALKEAYEGSKGYGPKGFFTVA